MVTVRLLRTRGLPILRQLQIEEALLRTTSDNWCLINDGCLTPAIVVGVSGKPQELVHEEAARDAAIQVIKRFSGGGTVVVDNQTLFATFVMQSDALPDVECYPRPIMQWSSIFYAPVFGPHGDFRLQEQDYAFGHSKFGGNAQAITKQRWLHHTSFLWDYDPARMMLLKHPLKTPEYRLGRQHSDFICCLKDKVPDRKSLLDAMQQRLTDFGFNVQEASFDEVQTFTAREYLKHNRVIQLS